ncbi:Hypothetical protein A7982_03659 [Minicystis rosea]|nr:Hypothetical protein A7982_03659 [Minicystis rosea]
MSLRRLIVLAPVAFAALAGLACGSKTPPAGTPAGPTMTCPPPIGVVPKEDCHEISEDFGALDVNGALPLASQGKGAEPRIAAIKAVGALAASIKEQRVKLCEQTQKCKVSAAEHEEQDKKLTSAMRSLIDLWNKRRFSGTDEVIRFREAVRAIDMRVNGNDGVAPAAAAKPPRTFKAEEAFSRVEDAGVAFRVAGTSITVSATAAGNRDALRTKGDAVTLVGGHRYRVKVMGQYTPTTAPVIQPGDELTARFKYRAAQAADLQVALRSLEDPEGEGAESIRVGAGEKNARELKLTADPQQTGFFLGFAVKGAPVELDDVELLRGGKVILAARGEGAEDAGVKSECSVSKDKPLSGKGSLQCAPGNGDRLTLGKPEGYLVITLRDSAGERSTLRTLSLAGGRSVDAALREDGGEVTISLVGAGSATIDQIEVTDLGSG